MLSGLQLITHDGTTFMVPQRIDGLPDVDNQVPLPEPPKIRVRSELTSVLAIEDNALYLRNLYFFCRGSPPPWQQTFPRAILTEEGCAWLYDVRLPLPHTGVTMGFTEIATAVFVFKDGKLLAFRRSEDDAGTGRPLPSLS